MEVKDYNTYCAYLREIVAIRASSAVLHWDKEVYMPKQGGNSRAFQLSVLEGIAHEKFTDPAFGTALDKLLNDSSLDQEQLINLERTREDFVKATKLDKAFVEKSTRIISKAFQAWQQARNENNFELFTPLLSQIVDLKREEADKLGYENHPYNALLDHYEPGITVKVLDPLFKDVSRKLLPLVRRISNAEQVDSAFLSRNYEEELQWNFTMDVLRRLNYDFESGRQDRSPHPFTIGIAPGDVRITTRSKADDFGYMLWSSIHECGHALYEQGLPTEHWGTPLGSAASLSIHESQSRFWENHIGRFKSFWVFNYPKLKATFPQALANIDLGAFYRGINKVRPGFIRTESDELHYHFHVMIRYEIEKELMDGSLHVVNLAERWNEAYKAYLGLEVESDKMGVLQDIHWAHGSIGYFPTYSLGSFYASQFYDAAEKSIPNMKDKICQGHYEEILLWLREMIHLRGRKYKSQALCEIVTGEKLSLGSFLNYVKNKYGEIYGISEWGDLG